MNAERDDRDDAPSDDDVGFLGGGGPASTFDADAEDELDYHGDNLSQVDDEDA